AHDERMTRRKAAEQRQGGLRGDVSRGELELETLREEAHRRRSRLASLSEIQDRYESFQKGVRSIMQHREALSASGGAGIRGVVVVDNLTRALQLWRETKTSKTIVTLEGEVIDPHGVVTGGAKESATAGVLEQKREIRELEEVVTRLEADTQAALTRHVEKK